MESALNNNSSVINNISTTNKSNIINNGYLKTDINYTDNKLSNEINCNNFNKTDQNLYMNGFSQNIIKELIKNELDLDLFLDNNNNNIDKNSYKDSKSSIKTIKTISDIKEKNVENDMKVSSDNNGCNTQKTYQIKGSPSDKIEKKNSALSKIDVKNVSNKSHIKSTVSNKIIKTNESNPPKHRENPCNKSKNTKSSSNISNILPSQPDNPHINCPKTTAKKSKNIKKSQSNNKFSISRRVLRNKISSNKSKKSVQKTKKILNESQSSETRREETSNVDKLKLIDKHKILLDENNDFCGSFVEREIERRGVG